MAKGAHFSAAGPRPRGESASQAGSNRCCLLQIPQIALIIPSARAGSIKIQIFKWHLPERTPGASVWVLGPRYTVASLFVGFVCSKGWDKQTISIQFFFFRSCVFSCILFPISQETPDVRIWKVWNMLLHKSFYFLSNSPLSSTFSKIHSELQKKTFVVWLSV